MYCRSRGRLSCCLLQLHRTRQHKFHLPAHKQQLPASAGQVHKVIARVSSSISYQMLSHESNYSMYGWLSPTAVQFSSLSDSEISSGGALCQLQSLTNVSRLHLVVRHNVCGHSPAVTFIPPSTEKMSKAFRLISPAVNSSYLS